MDLYVNVLPVHKKDLGLETQGNWLFPIPNDKGKKIDLLFSHL